MEEAWRTGWAGFFRSANHSSIVSTSAADTHQATNGAHKCTSAGEEAPCPFKMCNYKEAGDYLQATVHCALSDWTAGRWLIPCDYAQVDFLLTTRDVKHSALICSDCTGNEPFSVLLMKSKNNSHFHSARAKNSNGFNNLVMAAFTW